MAIQYTLYMHHAPMRYSHEDLDKRDSIVCSIVLHTADV